jgi:hypothetical protein
MPFVASMNRRRKALMKASRERPVQPSRAQRVRMQRMALIRHAMEGEQTRNKAAITLPKLKFLEDDR